MTISSADAAKYAEALFICYRWRHDAMPFNKRLVANLRLTRKQVTDVFSWV